MASIPTVFIQEHAIETGFGSTVAIAVRAPEITLVPPAPGGTTDPHGEIYIPITATAVVEGPLGITIPLAPGAVVRVAITRQGLGDLCRLAGQYAGYLENAYPPVA